MMQIKCSFSLYLLLILFLFSCVKPNDTEKNKLQAKVDSLQAKVDSLQLLAEAREDGDINEYVEEMNRIYHRLEVIKLNQAIINDAYRYSEKELSKDKRNMIQESINIIETLMYENQIKIDSLRKKLVYAPVVNAQLQEWVNTLSAKISSKAKEVGYLNEQLSKINIYAENLTRMRDSLNSVIVDQTDLLNTVYFCKGTFKELSNNGILEKGVGVSKENSKLRADFNTNFFTKTDRRNIKEISLNAKKVTFKTSHPSGSYSLVTQNKKVTKLIISNPGKFWSNSKYCVMMLEL